MAAEREQLDRKPARYHVEALEAAVDRLDRELGSTGASNSERIAALTAVVNGRAALLNATPNRRHR